MPAEKGFLLTPWLAVPVDASLQDLADHGMERRYRAGGQLFREGEKAGELFLLLKGKVKLTITYPHGSELLLAVYEDKSLFGFSALEGGDYFTTAVALDNCEVIVIPVAKIMEFAQNNPRVAFGLLKCLSIENRRLTGQLSCIALTDASARVIRLLALFSLNSCEKDHLECTHQDIANATGLCRSSVTLILNVLEQAGIIGKARSRIIILDKERLQFLLDDKNCIRGRAIDNI